MTMKPADSPSPTPIPAEWHDPALVLRHLEDELVTWLSRLRAIEHDLAVIQGALDVEPSPSEQSGVAALGLRDRERLLEGITTVKARPEEVHHDIAGRVQAFRLITEALRRGC